MSTETLLTIVGVLIGSQGLWTFIQTVYIQRRKFTSAEDKLLLGLAFNRIIEICQQYIEKGEIGADEYKELNHYLFEPYKEMGGNGTAARLVAEVEKLPIKKGA